GSTDSSTTGCSSPPTATCCTSPPTPTPCSICCSTPGRPPRFPKSIPPFADPRGNRHVGQYRRAPHPPWHPQHDPLEGRAAGDGPGPGGLLQPLLLQLLPRPVCHRQGETAGAQEVRRTDRLLRLSALAGPRADGRLDRHRKARRQEHQPRDQQHGEGEE